jgi:hypothetical protein
MLRLGRQARLHELLRFFKRHTWFGVLRDGGNAQPGDDDKGCDGFHVLHFTLKPGDTEPEKLIANS